jgi:hypothetical protein
VEDRISGLKDKIDIKEKTEEFLDKKIQELHNNWRLNTTLLNDQ